MSNKPSEEFICDSHKIFKALELMHYCWVNQIQLSSVNLKEIEQLINKHKSYGEKKLSKSNQS